MCPSRCRRGTGTYNQASSHEGGHRSRHSSSGALFFAYNRIFCLHITAFTSGPDASHSGIAVGSPRFYRFVTRRSDPSEIAPSVSMRPMSSGGSSGIREDLTGSLPVSLSPIRQLGGLLPVERLDVGFVCSAVVEPVRLPDGLHQSEHLADRRQDEQAESGEDADDPSD